MTSTPLGIEPGDIIAINLTHPLRYANPHGGDEAHLRGLIRMEVDAVSEIGIAGRGTEVEGRVVPRRGGDYDRVGGDPTEPPTFFPWSSVQNMTLMYKAAAYQALWDAEKDWP